MLASRRPPLLLGVVAALVAVAVTTGLLYALREVAPPISLGVVYLVAVLGISVVWGAALGAATGVASAAAFDFFHIAPTGTFSIGRGEDVVAMAVFFVAAVLTGSLAEAARAKGREAEDGRREAGLAAELGEVLLGSDDLAAALPAAAGRIGATFDLPGVALVQEEPAASGRGQVLALRDGLGWLVVPGSMPAATRDRLEHAVLPTLDALLAVATTRRALLDEVVETRALRRSEDLKTTLLRTVSHDLRTPLTAIAASVEALASPRIPDDERRDLAHGAAVQARDLAALVDDLLDLSRLEAGHAEPRRTWLAIDEVLDAAGDGLAGDRLELRLRSDLPMLRADPAQLERAFHNLFDNAMRHSGAHPVAVRAGVVGDRLVVRVTDRGPGVPEVEHERIFEPFYRAAGDAAASAGSGLGLAIVRGFVESNGGTVHVESYPGQGASFVVRLPLEPAAA